MPGRSISGLTKEELMAFQKLIRNIELTDIFVRKMSYERNYDTLYKGINGNLNVDVSMKPGPISYANDTMIVIKPYKVNLQSGKETILSLEVEYRLVFDLKDIEIVKTNLENEKVRKFFLDRQIMRFVWPFLREEFNSACGKTGIRPLVLPLLL